MRFVVAVLVASGLLAAPAAAQVSLDHEGLPGVWLPLDEARAQYAELQRLDALEELTVLQEQQLQLRLEQIEHLRELAQIAETAEVQAFTVIEDAERRILEAEERADAWYRSPTLWFTLGAVVAIALGALAIYGLDQLTAE